MKLGVYNIYRNLGPLRFTHACKHLLCFVLPFEDKNKYFHLLKNVTGEISVSTLK